MVGCRVNCIRYCPQEVIAAKYRGERVLSLGKFKEYITTIPKEIPIIFSGVADPFMNPECTDMILHAHRKGHRVLVFSTLTGMSINDAQRLAAVPVERFVLHLPDAEGNAHINVNRDYLTVLGYILTHIHNLEFMNMGAKFVSNKNEERIRGLPQEQKRGPVMCWRLNEPNYFMMPNGDVFLCCMTRGLEEKIGSITEYTYPELAAKFKQKSLEMRTDPTSICHSCTGSLPWYIWQAIKLKRLVWK